MSTTGRASVVALMLALSASLSAQVDSVAANDSTIRGERGDIIGVPFVYYSPETKWAGGGRLAYYWKDARSHVYTNLFISQMRQYELFFGGIVYKSDWRYTGKLKGSKWVDSYYGIGNDTRREDRVTYTEKFGWVFLSAQRLVGKVYAGLEFEARVENMVDTLPGDPEGEEDWSAAGLGVRASYDSRDNAHFPRKGSFLEASTRGFLPILGAQRYGRLLVDLRAFRPILKQSVIGVQFRGDVCVGDVPIQVMPTAGDVVRGYEKPRYRDKAAVGAQVEARFPIWRRLGAVVFMGAGDAFHEASDLGASRVKVAAGCGGRFRLTDDGVNLRVDWAVTRSGGMNFYVEIGEAF